jgi:cytochrome c oxidase assembly factor CtaG
MFGLSAAWDPAPAVLGAAVATLLLFMHGFIRLRRRGRTDHASFGRVVLFAAGVTCATLPLVSPLDAAGDRFLISAHMLEHMLVGDAAPALILLALRGPLLFFSIPAAVLGPFARLAPLRTALGFIVRPGVSLSAWALVFAAWHVPAAYDFAVRHQSVHELEHASFVLAGFLVWTQLVDPARHGRLSLAQRLAFAGGLFGLGQVLSNVLLLWPHPLYPVYASQPERLFGWSALKDQQIAGLVMMGEQLLTLGTFTLLVLFRPLAGASTSSFAGGRADAPGSTGRAAACP